MVRKALDESILRILTPHKSIDILRQVAIAKENNEPYSYNNNIIK